MGASGVDGSRAGGDSVTAIRNGDRDAFNAQVDRWVYRIYDVALSILGSTAAAVEVSRETIESLWDRHLNLSADDLTRDSLLIATRERTTSVSATSPSTTTIAPTTTESPAPTTVTTTTAATPTTTTTASTTTAAPATTAAP